MGRVWGPYGASVAYRGLAGNGVDNAATTICTADGRPAQSEAKPSDSQKSLFTLLDPHGQGLGLRGFRDLYVQIHLWFRAAFWAADRIDREARLVKQG